MDLPKEFDLYAARMRTEFDSDYGGQTLLWSTEQTNIVLEMYALFKQATVGDVNVPQPWMIDVVSFRKWGVWSSLQGMSKEQAMLKYINRAKELLSRHSPS
jgi:diazepam-binding inhibitor (GABA receptor modulating acyl-CoA-binding protein)